ncbi:MAG: alkaline phosphatase D family protein [Flavobacteriales bacterium]|nr:MAG: alkaline phosphatase D family protein [Flavobacteriales bacterium]
MRWLLPLLLFIGDALCAQDSVLHHWSGALAHDRIRVHAQLSGPNDSVRLLLDDDPFWGSPLWSPYMTADTSRDLVVPFRMHGLQPGTHYKYRFEVSGTTDTSAPNIGDFRTPEAGPYSFSFTTGSCNGSGAHPVWQSMQWLQPLFFLSLGDLHYAEPTSTDVNVHRDAYVNEVYTKHPMIDFLHMTPLAHVWDDHDFSGNASNTHSVGKPSAARAYREHVPHYKLAHDTAVYQAFTIGRVRFILTDMHATKDSTHMMDSMQHAWLREQLLLARDSGLVACWATTLSWNSIGYPENWGSAPQEREQLGNWLRDNAIDDLFILSGDAHMLAIDDGANADFSTGQSSSYRYPILQAAGLNRGGSYKGGMFNQGGSFPNPTEAFGQFGEVLVDDDGTDVCITLRGWRTDSLAPAISLINSYTFCRTPQAIDASGIAEQGLALRTWFDAGTGLHIGGMDGGGELQTLLVDATGRSVFNASVPSPNGEHVVPLRDLKPGAYVAIVRLGSERAIVKFVKP